MHVTRKIGNIENWSNIYRLKLILPQIYENTNGEKAPLKIACLLSM